MSSSLVKTIADIVGPRHVLVDPETTRAFRTDWTGRWVGDCRAVVRPADTAEAAAVVAVCAGAGVAVIPQGGNTGLVGATVPDSGSVIVSTLRLDTVGPVDDTDGQLTVGAGATLAAVRAAARAAGWQYPVDIAARDSATIGGTIATNAGGHHVIRYGMTRRHVVGIEAVMADATVVSHLGGLVKDNTGYDLASLLCGSEGTLGLITAARLALTPPPGEHAVALLGFEHPAEAVAAIGPLRRGLSGLEAIEIMFADGMAAVAQVHGLESPVGPAAVVLLVEVAGASPLDALAEALTPIEGIIATAVADDPRRRAELWRWRDSHTEVINQLGETPPHKLDVTLPIARLAEFVPAVATVVSQLAPTAKLWLFGHAGDGNLHVNITGLTASDDHVDGAVLELVASMGGSISAEHGIGRAKRSWLHLNRSPEEIAAFTAIKAALDPDGLFSPGVLLPDPA